MWQDNWKRNTKKSEEDYGMTGHMAAEGCRTDHLKHMLCDALIWGNFFNTKLIYLIQIKTLPEVLSSVTTTKYVSVLAICISGFLSRIKKGHWLATKLGQPTCTITAPLYTPLMKTHDAVIKISKISIPYSLWGSIAWEELLFTIIEITLRNWTILELGSNTSNWAVSIPGRDTNLNGMIYLTLKVKKYGKDLSRRTQTPTIV